MAITVIGYRRRMCIGPGYVDMFVAQVAGNTDPGTARIHNPRLEGMICPISATTGAGDMTVTYTAQTPALKSVLVTFSQTAANERCCFQLWGY